MKVGSVTDTTVISEAPKVGVGLRGCTTHRNLKKIKENTCFRHDNKRFT
jgi:hypothetical protein